MGVIGNALIRKANCKVVDLLNCDAFQKMKQGANTGMPFPEMLRVTKLIVIVFFAELRS